MIERREGEVIELDKEVQEFLRNKGLSDTKFMIAIDGKGRPALLAPPGVHGKPLEDADFEQGIEAKKIKDVTSSALVHFEGSNCYIYETTIAGQRMRWVFCW